jgi:hypothetical protein
MWGYLTEFWSAVQQVGDYPVAWFQSVGNAVAGAIGGIFEDLTHHFYDIFYICEWFLSNLGTMLNNAFTPLIWIFNFVRGFFVSATMTREQLGISIPQFTLLTDNVRAFFEIVPYFNLLLTAIAGCFGILIVLYIVRRASSV